MDRKAETNEKKLEKEKKKHKFRPQRRETTRCKDVRRGEVGVYIWSMLGSSSTPRTKRIFRLEET